MIRRKRNLCPTCLGKKLYEGRPCPDCRMTGTIGSARIRTHYGKTSCMGGCGRNWHHSREEAQYCDQLNLFRRNKTIKDYKSQVRYDLKDAHGRNCGYMIVDFVVEKPDGSICVVEYKGKGLQNMQEFRHKKALFSWCYPELEYHVATRGDIVLW